MSFDLVSTVTQLISPELIAKIAQALGLERTLAARAVGALVPSLLGGFATATGTPAGAAQLAKSIGSLSPDVLVQIGNMVGTSHQATLVTDGTGLLGQVLGGAATSGMADAVARYAGIDGAASKGLVGMIGPAVMGSLAQVQRSHGLDAMGLASVLAGQKADIAARIPADFALGARPGSPFVGVATGAATAAVNAVTTGAGQVTGQVTPVAPTGYSNGQGVDTIRRGAAGFTGGGRRLLWWVPFLALFVAGLWWLADSNKKKVQLVIAEKARIEAAEMAKAKADAAAAAAKAKADAEAAMARAAAEAKAKVEAEAAAAKARAEAEAKQKAEAEATAAKARAEMDVKQRAEVDAAADRQRDEADAAAKKLRLEAEAKQKAEIDAMAAKLRMEADAKEKAEAESDAAAVAAKARMEADAKQKADADAMAAKARAEADAKQKVEATDAMAAMKQAEIRTCQETVNQAATSGPLRFRVASATIAQDSTATLDRLVAAIKACPAAKLRIEGHTDADGDNAANQLLSENRAKAVSAYLSKAGVDAARLTATGFGETKPIAPNDTPENKAKNRRIDFVVLAN